MDHRYLRLNIPSYPYQQNLGRLALLRLGQLGAHVHLMDDGLVDMETDQPDVHRHLFQLQSGRSDALLISGRHLPLRLPSGLRIAGALPGPSRAMASMGKPEACSFFAASDPVSATAYQQKYPNQIRVNPKPAQTGFPTYFHAGYGAACRLVAISELELAETPRNFYQILPNIIGAPGTGHWLLLRRADKESCSWMLDAVTDPVASLLVQLERNIGTDILDFSGQLAGVRVDCLQRNRLKVDVWIPAGPCVRAIRYQRVIPYASPYLFLGQVMRELHKKGLPLNLPTEVW